MNNQWMIKFAQFQNLVGILSFITLKIRKLCELYFYHFGAIFNIGG